MRISCAMMATSVIPPTKEEGAEVDGAVKARGVVIYDWGCLDQSCAKLCLTVAVSMTHIKKKKWGDSR